MTVLVDTSVWVDHFRRPTAVLKRWGFTPQTPIKRPSNAHQTPIKSACEQNLQAVPAWLTSEYPGLAQRAVAVKQR